MKVLDAIILAVVQGLTEFLPVSSKTHLLFTRHFLKLPVDLFFDVTLHIGSLAAILVYYRKAWLELLRERRGEIPRLALATVPLIVAALLFRKHLAAAYENLTLAAGMLLVTAAWLFIAERFSFGFNCSKSAASPVTSAVEKDVPLHNAQRFSG